jgi:hypothetical protein
MLFVKAEDKRAKCTAALKKHYFPFLSSVFIAEPTGLTRQHINVATFATKPRVCTLNATRENNLEDK